jgi:Aluminium induced protein
MLAVFDRTVAKCPEGLRRPEMEEGAKGGSLAALLDQFSSVHEKAVTVRLGSAAFMAFATDKQNPFLPRYCVVSIILCFAFGEND